MYLSKSWTVVWRKHNVIIYLCKMLWSHCVSAAGFFFNEVEFNCMFWFLVHIFSVRTVTAMKRNCVSGATHEGTCFILNEYKLIFMRTELLVLNIDPVKFNRNFCTKQRIFEEKQFHRLTHARTCNHGHDGKFTIHMDNGAMPMMTGPATTCNRML